MILRVTAVQFDRFLLSGRTAPALCACEYQTGAMGEYVVKLRGAVGQSGLIKEVIAARLAQHFGLAAPEPALIIMPDALVRLIAAAEPSHADRIRASAGLNFGTRFLTGGSTGPIDNPDRRYSPNPNLLVQGGKLFSYDHETAFSFLEALLPPATPGNSGTSVTSRTTFSTGN